MKVLLATTNRGKVQEFQKLAVEAISLASPLETSYQSVKIPSVLEDGQTYFENALKKAIAFNYAYKTAVLADDSGLEVELLDGRPGVHSAVYGGEKLTFPERWNKLYEELAPHPATRWLARFRCVLCYYDGRGVPHFFEGTTEGRIAPAPAGKNGFGYDPIFYSSSLGLTFGEASAEEKDQISHRAEAFRTFLEWWRLDHT